MPGGTIPVGHGATCYVKPAWCPPAGGGPGTAPDGKRRTTTKAGEAATCYGKSFGGHPPKTSGAPMWVSATTGDAKADSVIDNLKKQVQLLEADNSSLRTKAPSQLYPIGGEPGGGMGGIGVDGAIQQIRATYERTEGAHAAKEAELTAAAERYRKEALAAKLRERSAFEELAEAKDHLSQQRDKFAAARQELTAEVIAYQRDLDELAHEKRQLQADLADSQRTLAEKEDFMQNFDAKVRLLENQLEAKGEEAKRAQQDCGLLRADLGEAHAQLAAVNDKYSVLRSQQKSVDDLGKSFVDERNEARAELVKVQIALEHEQQARKLADEAKNFLVMETTKLEATIKELSATAEFIAQDNARLKHAADEQKVMKVVGKFMVRKMREKLTEAKASEQVMRDNQAGINHKLVRSEQKASAIERELMVLRRRAAEREAAFEQQATDAKDLSTENRMLLERSEQLVHELKTAKLKQADTAEKNVQIQAELDVVKEKNEVMTALGKFRPEELQSVARHNAELAESIQALLPKLDSQKPKKPSYAAPAPATGYGEPLFSQGLTSSM